MLHHFCDKIALSISFITFHQYQVLLFTVTDWYYCFHGSRFRVKVVKQKQEVNCEGLLPLVANKP